MASRPKSGSAGTRRASTRNRKPATIDLNAKEVTSTEAKASSPGARKTPVPESKTVETKAENSPKSGEFGRAASPAGKKAVSNSTPSDTSRKSSSSNTNNAQSEKATPTPSKSAGGTKSVEAREKRGGGFIPAIGGALVAVLSLGVIGQFEGANSIPFIGSLYSNDSEISGTVDEGRFAELVEKVDGLSNNTGSSPEVDLGPLNAKVTELENLISSLTTATSDDSSVSDASLVARIEAIEAGVEGVKQDLAKIGADASAGTDVDIESAIAAVNSRIDGIENQNAQSNEVEKLAQLEGVIAEISGGLENVQAATLKNSEQLNELVSQSSELKDTVASVQASEKVAKSVAVNALATALDNDDPLNLPISSVEALVGETPETKRLMELVQIGIPTLKELAASLDTFTATVQNPSGLSKDASLSDKFWANAQSLVTFRSTGPREGDDPLAILSRVKANTVSGNLEGAKSEWQKLPVSVQENGNGWLAKLEVRLEAYALQREISSKLALQAG